MSTLEPRISNCVRTSRRAPLPIDTIVMTAAMPITPPSTVNPERSLFFPSVRSEMTSRSNRSTGLPRRGSVYPGHERLSFGQLALQHFRELVLNESDRDGHGPQQRPVFNPNQALLTALRQLRFL